MNLLLLEREDLLAEDFAVVDAARYPVRGELWPPQPGRRLRVGLSGGLLGEAIVERVAQGGVYLRFACHAAAPPPLPLILVLALPRPKMLRRVLRSIAELGIKRLCLVNAARVEKSYWQSPLLQGAALRQYLVAGLEQACDTVLPEVSLHPWLRPFVEDELAALSKGCERLLAHPAAPEPGRAAHGRKVALAVGPEGGLTDFEVALFGNAGFSAFTLGPRILRVETALPALAATLFPPQ